MSALMFNAGYGSSEVTGTAARDTRGEAAAGGTPLPRTQAATELQLQAWIRCVMRQDEAAFGALYEACVGRVYSLALRITRNPAQAEEVTEDTFWQTWREAPRFDPSRGTVLAWILTKIGRAHV